MSSELGNGSTQSKVDWKRILFILTGIVLFALVYMSPPWPDAVDPMGKHFPLQSRRKRCPGPLFAGRNVVDF